VRFKVAPPATSLDALAEARAAIPLVPDSEADCCRAIQTSLDLRTREAARELLTFLRALDLVDATDRGYYRTRDPLDRAAAADAFRENVFGVAELLGALGSTPRGLDAVFEDVRDAIPEWERNRHADWESAWRERVEHLLDWGVVFGLVRVDDDGYRLAGQ
jgi:hypothetical protein